MAASTDGKHPSAVSHIPKIKMIAQPPPALELLRLAILVFLTKSIISLLKKQQRVMEYFIPPTVKPDLVKSYLVRPNLAARIFFPADYDQTATLALPTLFSVHGGCFLFGDPAEDDHYNRHFADTQGAIVVALAYMTAPEHPFPTAVHDIEAVILAVLADQSLPIRRVSPIQAAAGRKHSYTAILGFSAGGNLAMAASQLPSLRGHPDGPAAAVSIYGVLDLCRSSRSKTANRPYKPSLGGARGAEKELLYPIADGMDWAYVPYGYDRSDPLVSPFYAGLNDLPPYVAFVSAELDSLSYDGWGMACRLRADARQSMNPDQPLDAAELKRIPDQDSEDPRLRVMGSPELCDPSRPLQGTWDWETGLGERDERFGWDEEWKTGDGQNRAIKWLLVPDVLHGFDNELARKNLWDEETRTDAAWKHEAYVKELGGWLRKTVWQV